jgi:PAS domain S-box-containing protein
VLAAVVATSSDAIICVDGAQRIVEFNQGAERMFLWGREDVLGKPLEILIPARFRRAHSTSVQGYAARGEPRRMASDRPAVRGIRSNGEEFDVEATIARHELDGQRWLSVIVRDLDASARVEMAHARRWHALFEAASDGIFIADLDGRYVDVNTAGCQLVGYRRDELIGKHIVDVLAADQVEDLAKVRRELDAGNVQIRERVLRRKDGSVLPVEISAKILADGRWVAFARDISDRKAMEAALHLDQQRLRVALTGSPISAFTQDRMLRYTWSFNPPASLTPADIVGKTQEEMAPSAPSALTPPLSELKQRVLDTGVPARTLICNVIGGTECYFDTTIEPLRDEQDRIIGITGAAWDVTDRKRAEDAQRLFAEVSAVLTAATLDWTQVLARVAPVALGMLADFCIAELLDDVGHVQRRDVVDIDPDRAAQCEALRRIEIDRERPHLGFEVFRTSEPLLVADLPPDYLASVAQSDHDLALLRGIGLRSLIVVPLLGGGRPLGAYVLGSRTRRYSADDLRLATEFAQRVAVAVDNARLHRVVQRALDVRAEVLAIVAHDLRNPLYSVMLQIEHLSRRREDPVQVGLAIDLIRRSTRRMNRLIQDLLDVVRLEAGEPLAIELASVAPVHVAEEALDSLRGQAAASLLELELRCGAGLPDVRADHARLVQVLDNLVGNAIKFSRRGARVVLAIHQEGEDVVFSVADTGPGISPEQLGHMFDRFWQAERNDRRGIGLGLSVAKGIVEAHHGKIWVHSSVGSGTTFYFTVPIATAVPSSPAPSAAR